MLVGMGHWSEWSVVRSVIGPKNHRELRGTASLKHWTTEKLLKLKLFMLHQARATLGQGGSYPPPQMDALPPP